MKALKLTAFFLFMSLLAMSQRPSGRVGIEVEMPLEGTVFHLRNVMSNRYIDLPGSDTDNRSRENGANVQLWDLDQGKDRQLTFIPAGDGYYHIRFQHKNVQLDVHGCFNNRYFCKKYKRDKGANIQIWNSDSGHVQQWKLEQIRPGQFRILNRYSGKYLDASLSNIHRNGANVLQWNWNGGDNQLWELVCVKTGKKYQVK